MYIVGDSLAAQMLSRHHYFFDQISTLEFLDRGQQRTWMDSLETLVALQEDGELTDIVIDEWLLFDIFMVTENWT